MYKTLVWTGLVVVCWICTAGAAWAQTLLPVKDGTLADGGTYGVFDGVPDIADWYFNASSFEGSISLAVGGPGGGLDRRVVWEYDLSDITREPPVSATLGFSLRGAFGFPVPEDVDVHVYAYPSDLVESMDDFAGGTGGVAGCCHRGGGSGSDGVCG